MLADLLLIGIVCDFVPIMPLMVFHYRNFQVKKQSTKMATSSLDDLSQTSDLLRHNSSVKEEAVQFFLVETESEER